MKRPLIAALGFLLVAVATPAMAGWPDQPIRIVVPYPAGGAVDAMLRVMAPKMSEKLGQPIVVDNRAGANANLGPAVVSKAKPDGYTLLASATFLLVNPLVDTELGWRPSDFQPIARLSMTHNLFTVGGSSPWQSLADFVAAARARPGLPIGSGGVGSPQSMAHELLRVRAGLEFNVIPYRGSPPMMIDLLNGSVVMGVLPLAAAKGGITSNSSFLPWLRIRMDAALASGACSNPSRKRPTNRSTSCSSTPPPARTALREMSCG